MQGSIMSFNSSVEEAVVMGSSPTLLAPSAMPSIDTPAIFAWQ